MWCNGQRTNFPVVDWFCLFIYLWVLTFPLEDCSEFGNFVITLIYILMWWFWYLLRNRSTCWVIHLIVISHWSKSMGRHVAPLEHIILILRKPVFVLTPLCFMLQWRSNKNQFCSLWFDQTRARIHNLQHLRRICWPYWMWY
jgi:hypothetical protein